MSIRILSQVIDYDKTTQSWARYAMNDISTMNVTLIKYHTSQAEAIMVAVPDLVRSWAANSDADQGRIARAAAIALDRKAITNGDPGTHQVKSQNGNGTYTVTDDRCTCPDWRPGRHCKHELAIQARALLDEATITLTTDCHVTGSNANPIKGDEKLITVQEGTDAPRKPRNPQFLTAVRWLLDRNYELYQCYWTQKPLQAVTHRTKRYHYIPMKETAQ